MIDVHSAEQRRRNMCRIRGKDTKPEMILRRGLHANGFRFRLHDRALPGSPDLVLAKYRAVVFVHGCFWHGHACPRFTLPATRSDFWAEKIAANQRRDLRSCLALRDQGWRILVVWECAVIGPAKISLSDVLRSCAKFFESETSHSQLAGLWP